MNENRIKLIEEFKAWVITGLGKRIDEPSDIFNKEWENMKKNQ